MNKYTRYIVIAIIIAIIGFSIYYLESQKVKITTDDVKYEDLFLKGASDMYPKAKEISSPDGFINTDSVKIADHIGKDIILVDFWTYSCINCQRTLPYLNQWQEKYGDKGLLIIGVHTPEFEFEKKYENVLAATKKYGIKYPVVLDNDYSTWTAYGNRYWPRKYIIDLKGNIVYDHIGEGGYQETEMVIQKLLEERAKQLDQNLVIDKNITTPQNAETVDFNRMQTPEIYFGANRNQWLDNGSVIIGETQTFVKPNIVKKNKIYLTGDWDFTSEYAVTKNTNSHIIIKYEAEKVFFVASSETLNKVRVLQDGKEITVNAGEDVVNGVVEIEADDLYRLVNNKDGSGEHTLELIIEGPGLKAFTFTFG